MSSPLREREGKSPKCMGMIKAYLDWGMGTGFVDVFEAGGLVACFEIAQETCSDVIDDTHAYS